jgi:hypothetical protein
MLPQTYVLNVFTEDEVLESLKQLEKMKFNNGACLAAVVWAKQVKLYKLPTFLSELQISAFQKRRCAITLRPLGCEMGASCAREASPLVHWRRRGGRRCRERRMLRGPGDNCPR